MSFRPTSKGHWGISLYGFIASIFAISLFSWQIGLCIFISQFIIFIAILKFRSENRVEGVWWGVVFSFVKRGLNSLHKIVQGTKNWRPILMSITFNGEKNYPDKIAYISEKIALYQGLVNMNIINDRRGENEIKKYDFTIPASLVAVNDPTEAVLSLVQSSNPSGIDPNSILLEYSKKINTVEVMNKILDLEKNIFLLKNAERFKKHEKIDIWWRGEKNGNLMVLLAYIMNSSVESSKRKNHSIRIIRKLNPGEKEEQVKKDITQIIEKARLNGEIVVLSEDENNFTETLEKVSKDSDLIILGLPGTIKNEGIKKLFKLNELFFIQEIEKYNNLPTILFVKSSTLFNLIEE